MKEKEVKEREEDQGDEERKLGSLGWKLKAGAGVLRVF